MSGQIHLLHHKSWHVWNKDNLAKIARDEKEAAEKEAQLKARAIDAERESRYERLSLKRKHPDTNLQTEENPDPDTAPTTNINFFADIERAEKDQSKSKRRKVEPHPEAESERKMAEERVEQQWVNYLGKDSIEKMKIKPWWYSDGPAPQLNEKKAAFEAKSKIRNDPLEAMNKYLEETANPVPVQVLEDPSLRERRKKHQTTPTTHKARHSTEIVDGMTAIKEMQVKEEEHRERKRHKKDKKDKDKKDKKQKDKHKRDKKEKRRKEKERLEEDKKLLEKLKFDDMRRQRMFREQQEAIKERQLLGIIPNKANQSQYPGGSTLHNSRFNTQIRGSM